MRDEKHITDLIENLFTCLFCIDILVAMIADIIVWQRELSTKQNPPIGGFYIAALTVGLSDESR